MQAPVWRPFALSTEKVTCGLCLLNLLHLATDAARQTNRVLALLVEKNIHYRILQLLYWAKNLLWNMPAYLGYVPVVYGVRAYKFLVTHTFRVFSAYSNLPTERPATPWFSHSIILKADSYGK